MRELKIDDYVIVNDFDRPCTRLIAKVKSIDDSGLAKFDYLTTGTSMKMASGPINEATLIADFGVIVVENPNDIFAKQVLKCVATYSDGSPRGWQPEHCEKWGLRDKVHVTQEGTNNGR